MKREIQLLAHLYGEADPDAPTLRELLEDPDLAREHRALSEAQFALDHRKRSRPSPGVVEAIVAAAPRGGLGRESTSRRNPGHAARWLDRPLLRSVTTRRRALVPAFAIAAAVALTVFIQPWSQIAPVPMDAAMAEADAPQESLVPPESLFRALPPAPSTSLAARADLPAWDTGSDLRQLHRRIRSLQAAGVTEWDEPAVPLELLPTDGRIPGLQTTGVRR